jgi:type IV pilus assembly protein PilA
MRKIITSNKGFSLIELMVVVAIIGVLSAIGIPQYSKFQAKARQSEAKTSLSALFTAEASFMAEWNTYSVSLLNVGFGVTGTRLRYVTGFAAAACTSYPLSAPPEATTVNDTWSDGTNVNVGVTAATFAYTPGGSRTLAGTTSECNGTAGSQAFRGMAQGDVQQNIGALPLDGWTINQAKVLANSTVGLR